MESAWAYMVPAIAIAGVFTFAIFSLYFKTRRRIAESEGSPAWGAELARSNELNARLLETMTAMDARLSSIERTLNEVG